MTAHLDINPSPHHTAATLHTAADLTLTLGPNPENCLRAAVYGRPDVPLPHADTAESLLVEEARHALFWHLNPDPAVDADTAITVDEWAPGRSVADVRGALLAAANEIEAGAR